METQRPRLTKTRGHAVERKGINNKKLRTILNHKLAGESMHGDCRTVGNIYGYTEAEVEDIKAKRKPFQPLPHTGDNIVANLERRRMCMDIERIQERIAVNGKM